MENQILVDLPEKRVTYKKGKNETKYVYYTIRSYRNEHGKPTSDEKSIGKLDKATGKLIPNRNYYELFPEERLDRPEKILSHGYFKVFQLLADSVGLPQTLASSFGEESKDLLSITAYMMAHGNVMMDYQDWAESSSGSGIVSLSSQKLSVLFSELKEEDRANFLRDWVKKAQDKEYIAYDVTSISSYSDEISHVERGYNRDKENLAQINLGLFFGESSRIPLYYTIYPGSIVDKSHLPFMMALTETIGMERVRFVMDQGFMTQGNLELIKGKKHFALSLIPKNYRLYKDLISEIIQVSFSARERLEKHDIYARSIETNYETMPVKVHFYYDPQKALLNEKALFDDIHRKEKVLEELVKQKKIKPSIKKYFDIQESGEKEISYQIDYDKIDSIRKELGYFALISTDKELSAEEALSIYRQKDVVEKSFDQLKNGMDYRRMRTHYTKTTEGKLFVAFLGLIMRSVFMTALKSHEATKGFTMKKVIRELEKIQHIQLKDGTIETMYLTKVQKTILSALNIDEELFN